MDLLKIAIRVAAGHISDHLATLPPLQELKETVEEMLAATKDPDMIDLLQDIINSCETGSPRAYLLMEDLAEMQDEIAIEGKGVPNWDLVVENYGSASF
jgi:hypothetical protein